MSVRNFVLGNPFLREVFFFLKRNKLNVNKIDKKIPKMDLINLSNKEENLVVSLTSYGERIKELKYTLYSLINQSLHPFKIMVNISYSDSDLISPELYEFEKYGVEFSFCEDLKSYKKLIPAIEKYSNKCIVTADDDLFYKKNWLEKLWKEHLKNPKNVICHLAYKITASNGKLESYQNWIHNYKFSRYDPSIFLLGGSGTLYPPESLYEDVCNKDLFFKLTPYADDIWFYFMAIINSTKITQVHNPHLKLIYVNPYREYGITDGHTLTRINVGENRNDSQLKNVLNYYKISEKSFIDFIEGLNENCILDC